MIILIGCLFRSMLENPSCHSNLSAFPYMGAKLWPCILSGIILEISGKPLNLWPFWRATEGFEGTWFNFMLHSKGPNLIQKFPQWADLNIASSTAILFRTPKQKICDFICYFSEKDGSISASSVKSPFYFFRGTIVASPIKPCVNLTSWAACKGDDSLTFNNGEKK